MTCICSKGRWSPECPVHPPTLGVAASTAPIIQPSAEDEGKLTKEKGSCDG